MNAVLEALQFRHACKKFDPERKIPSQDLEMILECGHISPSSFGMEPWKFLVIQNSELRSSLREVCWNQPQITDASDIVVILVKPDLLKPDTDYIKAMFHRRNMPEDAEKAYLDRYRSHMQEEVEPVMSYYSWGSKQCYIALANMMTAAAANGIDSCPIEGFEKAGAEKVLGIDTDQFQVAVIFALGFRAGEQSKRLRADSSEIIEYM
ncbi:MAG: NAD(P)H-dependent oxidoreductase [Gammaproteobacteria bacterium]|jgi:nitroreductase|nr:NAD(P)H-dependent oxidoreductase [Gammaproteobacteria bacterium]MBT3721990.1 NAD(P)H-dependent oxidoreductase [Gammaproteobacteria bacterium]MBT4077782.1 NAD(P)H-dependent oxidoreductase [Gammaproteobacteria bacterium]MBT4196795.1 NAD(P)H-dependent oxidoreductase [Gammaproteobacteria bacterium]MBT4449114.1 NAD(P)H-dependent oxidoreductase [Gammaproteobacteria bacterium]